MILRCQLVSLLKGVIIFFSQMSSASQNRKVHHRRSRESRHDGSGRIQASIAGDDLGTLHWFGPVDFDDALPDRDRERDIYLREQALAPQCDQSHFHVNESGPRG
jgi:CRISPR/Cas system CMR subunit Cmr6 (Cas7 group RAMP superfamily)